MNLNKKKFTVEEVEKLIKNAYEVGFCDGKESYEFRAYKSSNDFWINNKSKWLLLKINYIK